MLLVAVPATACSREVGSVLPPAFAHWREFVTRYVATARGVEARDMEKF